MPKTPLHKWERDPLGGFGGVAARLTPIVSSRYGGHLTCESHDNLWCEHIESVIKNDVDAASIESLSMQSMHLDSEYIPVSVPLIPTYGIFAKVIVMPLVRPEYAAKVYLQSPPQTESEHVVTGDDCLIGMITEGEGRRVIRSLVVTAFWPVMQQKLRPCMSTLHNYERAAEHSLYPGDKSDRERLAMAWTTHWYSKCYPCFTDEGPGQKFDDDLIPDTEPTRSSWRGSYRPAGPKFKR